MVCVCDYETKDILNTKLIKSTGEGSKEVGKFPWIQGSTFFFLETK